MRNSLTPGAASAATVLLALSFVPLAGAQTQPKSAPTATADGNSPATSTTALPTVKEIVEKSEKATGGEEVWKKMTTRTMKGIYQTQDDSEFIGVVILQKAPNKSVYVLTLPNGVEVRDVCDGTTAWLEDDRGGYHPYVGAALQSRLLRSDFSDHAKALLLMATGKVLGTEKVGTHTAYVVEYTPEKNITSKLYFDVETGYVVRDEDNYTTPDGPYRVTLDMDDYREVEGVKVPFRMRRMEKGAVYNIRLTQVKFNAPVDDSEFVKPESASN
jgi:zinc protease